MTVPTRKRTPYVVRPRTAVLTRGFDPRLSVGSARPAVFRSSTYVFSSPEAAERAFAIALGRSRPADDENIDLIYSRLSHPNAEILEDQLVPLEGGAQASAVFNSGMAAISTLFLHVCPPGTSFVYTTPLYGGTQHLVHQVLEPLGIRGIPTPAGDETALGAAIDEADNLRLVFIETPANPTLLMTDVRAAVARARKRAAFTNCRPLVAVDNTFLGPVFQQALELGVDLAVYSATKFLAGHSDMLGGAVMGRDSDLIEHLRGTRAILGNILQPDECWILDARLPTVDLRMSRQSKNAERVVDILAKHPKVERLYYPTLFRDPDQIRIYESQCKGPGSIFTFGIEGGRDAGRQFINALKLHSHLANVGDAKSLVIHPGSTTHQQLSDEEQLEAGISPDMIRISVGLEDLEDLLWDLDQALKVSQSGAAEQQASAG